MRAAVVLAILASFASPARAERGQVTLALDVDTVWRLDDAYRLFGRSRSGTDPGVTLSYDLLRLSDTSTLALAAGWHVESLGGEFGTGRATLDVRTLSLEGVLRLALRPWLEPHVRVALGSAWGEMAIGTDAGERLEGSAWSPQASVGAGFRFRSRPSPVKALRGAGVSFAAAVEGGFTAGAPMASAVAVPDPEDEKLAADRIPARPVDVGQLQRNHPYLRFSFAVGF